MRETKVCLIGEQVLIRRALAALITLNPDYRIAGEFSSCSDALADMDSPEQCLYIVDVEQEVSQISNLIKTVRSGIGRVVIFGTMQSKRKLVELLSLKADGYFLSNLSESEFFVLLDKVKKGMPVIADSLIPELVNVFSAQTANTEIEKLFLLTPREKEILKLLAEGYTNERIAKKLVISVYTVKNHVHNMLDKMGVQNRAQLVSYAFNSGLVKGQAG